MPSLVIQLAMGASLALPNPPGGMLPGGVGAMPLRGHLLRKGDLAAEESERGDLGKWGGEEGSKSPIGSLGEKGRLTASLAEDPAPPGFGDYACPELECDHDCGEGGMITLDARSSCCPFESCLSFQNQEGRSV